MNLAARITAPACAALCLGAMAPGAPDPARGAALPAASRMQATTGDPAATLGAIRASELALDAQALERRMREESDATARELAAIALEAVRVRLAETGARELRETEILLAGRRLALARRAGAACEACARELFLESAEDLLLRARAIGAADVAIAIGLPAPEELAASVRIEALAREALDEPVVAGAMKEGVDFATDAQGFRAAALAGLSALAEADRLRLAADLAAGPGLVARADPRERALRIAAAARLAQAAKTELRVGAALAATLAFARARADASASEREALLLSAAGAEDPALSFAARVESWARATGERAFPVPRAGDAPAAVVEALGLLAACTEARAQIRAGEPLRAIASPLERLLLRVKSADPTRVRPTIETLAARTAPIAALSRPADADAPVLTALALAAHGAPAFAASPELAERAAADPLLGPSIALRVAELAAAAGDLARAARVVTSAVRDFDGLPSARAAIELALEIDSARAKEDAAGESAYDASLAVALRRFPTDPARDAWAVARADLALHPSFHAAETARAREALLTVAPDGPAAPRRALREAEAAWIDLTARRARSADERREAAAQIRGDAERCARALAGSPDAARAETLAAVAALAAGAPEAAAERADRALAEPALDARTGERAALAAIEARSAIADAPQLPPEIARECARSTAVAARLDGELVRRTQSLAESLLARPPESGLSLAPAGDLARLADLARARGDAPSAIEARALAALLAGDCAEALRLSAGASDAQRSLDMLAAEALRCAGDDASRASAFERMKRLAPVSAAERDLVWWRAQLGQLEIAAATGTRRADIVSRVNRLALLDPGFADPRLARRFEALRAERSR